MRRPPTLAAAFAVAAFSTACRSTGAVPRPFPSPGGAPSTATVRPSARGVDSYALTGTALSLRGAPYRDGGTDPSGFDCSGFTQYVFSRHGVNLPRDVKEQFATGKSVRAEQIAAGDLVFFSTVAPGASHVGIALGGDEFVHAPSSKGVVRVERFSGSYWARRYVGARRID